MKLCPLRAATRAGQNAIATHRMRPISPQANHMMHLLVFGCGIVRHEPERLVLV